MNQRHFVIILLLAALVGLWFLRFWQVQPNFPVGRKIELTKVLDNQPKIIGQSQYFRLGQLRIRTSSFPRYTFGDRLKVRGVIEKDGRVNFPKVTRIEENAGNPILAAIAKLRVFLVGKINSIIGEPYASLVAGMLLGVDQMPVGFKKLLQDTGTIHVVVVSGQNVTMVAGLVMSLAGLIRRRLAIIITLGVIVFYTILAGGEPPVVRAAIMGGLAYTAQGLGRAQWSLLALFLAALMMLFFNPLLIFSLSFQLSFVATLGIIVLVPKISRFLTIFPHFAKEATAVSVSAYLLTLPIIAFAFSRISLVGIFANVAVYFLVAPIMILGFLTLVGSLLIPFFGRILSFFLLVPTFLFVWLINFANLLPQSTVSIQQFSFYWVFVYYLMLVMIFLWLPKLESPKN